MFTPITTRLQVPEVGRGFEGMVLDLKAHPYAYKPFKNAVQEWNEFELAKDVAAFANRLGGAILIGAEQDTATGTCSSQTPFAPALAVEFEIALRDALKLCRPSPLVEIEVIPFDPNVMVVVNVWAFPGQVVAVEVAGDKERGGYGGTTYVFPIRALSHTNYLTPEQIPMLMIPDIRRTAILLSTLKKGDRITAHPKIVVPEERGARAFNATFVSVDEMKNCLTVEVALPTGPIEAGLPLEDVSVWFEQSTCHIRCDRHLLIMR
jgi:hypothetical protein